MYPLHGRPSECCCEMRTVENFVPFRNISVNHIFRVYVYTLYTRAREHIIFTCYVRHVESGVVGVSFHRTMHCTAQYRSTSWPCCRPRRTTADVFHSHGRRNDGSKQRNDCSVEYRKRTAVVFFFVLRAGRTRRKVWVVRCYCFLFIIRVIVTTVSDNTNKIANFRFNPKLFTLKKVLGIVCVRSKLERTIGHECRLTDPKSDGGRRSRRWSLKGK